jgi:hypothetical protein
MSLADSLAQFRASVVKVDNFVSGAYKTDSNGQDLFDVDGKDFIVSSAYLKLFVAWESFLEEAFAKYLIGEISTDGTPVGRYVTVGDKAHAIKMMIGTQKYVDWANHEIVRRLAVLYLVDGEPLKTNLASIASDLADMKTVRNAAAHLSSTTQPQLAALATRVLGRPVTVTSVAEFITEIHPGDGASTVLQTYEKILDIAAENIAANRT